MATTLGALLREVSDATIALRKLASELRDASAPAQARAIEQVAQRLERAHYKALGDTQPIEVE